MFFFFNDTATTEIYTLSLHDALPISTASAMATHNNVRGSTGHREGSLGSRPRNWRWMFSCSAEKSMSFFFFLAIDRKSTRLNSSHQIISYAVFCLKKKKKRDHTLDNV